MCDLAPLAPLARALTPRPRMASAAAADAGVGHHGGLLVPLYSIVLGLGPKLAAPVSKATIFGVALGNAL